MYDYRCDLIRIIDGDTVELDIDLGFHAHMRATIRMLGFDAPEMATTAGKDAKSFLDSLLKAGPLTIRTTPDRRGDDKTDGFRRYLGDLYANGKSVNAVMIAKYGPYKPRAA